MRRKHRQHLFIDRAFERHDIVGQLIHRQPLPWLGHVQDLLFVAPGRRLSNRSDGPVLSRHGQWRLQWARPRAQFRLFVL